MNQSQKKKTAAKLDVEAILAVMLLALIVIAVVLAVIMTVSALTGDQSDDPNAGKNPPPSNAIFNNGIVPQMPAANATTQNANINSKYGIIVDIDTGLILAGKNADTQFEPASMTKVMSLIVACEKLTEEDLGKYITYSEYYKNYDYQGLAQGIPSSSFETLNDRFLVKDLLYGIGVMSAGDCMLMIAEYTYGSMDAFVAAMNQKVAALGLTQTHFIDASGNDHVPGNITTAKEMAVIMAYAMQSPLISDILSTDWYSFYAYYTEDGVEKSYRRAFKSTLFEYDACIDRSNRMLRYKEAYGEAFTLLTTDDFMGKTGYLDTPARSYLASAATGKTSGHRFVVIVGDTDKFAFTMKDVKDLLDTYAS
ncbi:MAG: D-alanyl-D-alanine carboxypeptidase [Clostridia bacterium]|nr:D-alanyl-D-alanine carboxypeptidase [Clostridia bacterium]